MRRGVSSWRLQPLISESFRRTFALPMRMLVLALASGAMLSAVLIVEVATLEDLANFRRKEIWQGRGIVIVDNVPSSERALLRSACTQISSQSGLVAVGGFQEPQIHSLETYPGIGVRLAALEDSTWRMWFPDSPVPSDGLAAGSGLAERVGLLAGDPIRLDGLPGQTFETELIIVAQRPFAQGEGWLLRPASIVEPIDQCWIEFAEPVDQRHVSQVAAAVANLSEYDIKPLIRTNDLTRNPTSEFKNRWTKWGPLANIIMIGSMYLLLLQSRRGEQAIYITAGLSRIEDYLMSFVEVAVVIVIPGVFISASVLYIHAAGSHVAAPLAHKLTAETQLLTLAMTLVVLPLLSTLKRRSSILDDLKTQ